MDVQRSRVVATSNTAPIANSTNAAGRSNVAQAVQLFKLKTVADVPTLDVGLCEGGTHVHADSAPDRVILQKAFAVIDGANTPISALQQKVCVGKNRVPRRAFDSLLQRAAAASLQATTAGKQPLFSIVSGGEASKKAMLSFNPDMPVLETSEEYANAHNFFMFLAQIDYGVLLELLKVQKQDQVPGALIAAAGRASSGSHISDHDGARSHDPRSAAHIVGP